MSILISVLAFILTIFILVAIHEYGHYAVARLFNVGVIKFSIGFGKPLFTYKHKSSGTLWILSRIPLGGYVQLLDERNLLEENKSEINEKPAQLPISNKYKQYSFESIHPIKKILIILAGPAINFIAAIIFFSIVAMYGIKDIKPVIEAKLNLDSSSILYKAGINNNFSVKTLSYNNTTYSIKSFSEILLHLSLANDSKYKVQLYGNNLESNNNQKYSIDFSSVNIQTTDIVNQIKPYVSSISVVKILPNSLAQNIGLQENDKIIAINNNKVTYSLLQQKLKTINTEPFNLYIKSNKNIINLKVNNPNKNNLNNSLNLKNPTVLGVQLQNNYEKITIKHNVTQAFQYGANQTAYIIKASVNSLIKMFVSSSEIKNLSGPIAISNMAKDSLLSGVDIFLQFLAFISISLGIMNLLPLPMLDGGQALIVFIEYLTKRNFPVKALVFMQKLGILFIIVLTFLAFKNDITKLIF